MTTYSDDSNARNITPARVGTILFGTRQGLTSAATDTLTTVAETLRKNYGAKTYKAWGSDACVYVFTVIRPTISYELALTIADQLLGHLPPEGRPGAFFWPDEVRPDRFTASRHLPQTGVEEEVGGLYYPTSARRFEGFGDLVAPHVIGGAVENLDLSDLGAKNRVLAAMHGTVLYVGERECFLAWNGKQWIADAGHVIQTVIEEQVSAIRAEAKATLELLGNPTSIPRNLSRVLEYCDGRGSSSTAIGAIYALLKREDTIRIASATFDANPWLLNTPTGLVDIRDSAARPHEAGARCAHITRAAYAPFATCPLFMSVIERAMGGSDEAVLFLQRRLGSMLCATNPEQVMTFFVGSGANGKSLIANAVAHALGTYARHVAPDSFMARTNRGEIREDLVALEGARFVLTSESNASDELDLAQIKRMTGNDPITARGGYQKMRTMQPTWKILFLANALPLVACPDPAVWRRLEVVPFNVVVPPSERDALLDHKLRDEDAGILRWLVEGCRVWFEAGCRANPPASVVAATKSFQSEQDPVRSWATDTEVVELLAGAEFGATAAYQSYCSWCEPAGGSPMSQTAFGRRVRGLTDLGITKGRSDTNAVVYRGLRPRPRR